MDMIRSGTAFVSATGAVVIPSDLRKELGIEEGTRLSVYREKNHLVLEPITDEFIHSLVGCLKSEDSLVAAREREHRIEKDPSREQDYVLDATRCWISLKPARDSGRSEKLLHRALRNEVSILLSVLNWGEVFYQLWQRRGEDKARRRSRNFRAFRLQIVPVDFPQAIKAGELKAVHKIPYVDCVTAALAVLNQAVLVTSDRDFEKLGKQFPILWIARA